LQYGPFLGCGFFGPAVLPQIRAFEAKGKLAILNPQRRLGCAALVPQYPLMRERHQGVEICAA
jgi:hypothetical protein